MACEESGKLSILIGAATYSSLGMQVDWKVTAKRFRSHSSKASQFLGLARAIPVILQAAQDGNKKVDIDAVLTKLLAGVLFGPDLFQSRNASIYCDFQSGFFRKPNEVINVEMLEKMIDYAEQNIGAGKLIVPGPAEQLKQAFVASGIPQKRRALEQSLEYQKKFVGGFYLEESREALKKLTSSGVLVNKSKKIK